MLHGASRVSTNADDLGHLKPSEHLMHVRGARNVSPPASRRFLHPTEPPKNRKSSPQLTPVLEFGLSAVDLPERRPLLGQPVKCVGAYVRIEMEYVLSADAAAGQAQSVRVSCHANEHPDTEWECRGTSPAPEWAGTGLSRPVGWD